MRKLRLQRVTIRSLTADELPAVAGGDNNDELANRTKPYSGYCIPTEGCFRGTIWRPGTLEGTRRI